MKLTVGATLQNGKYLIQEIQPGRLSVACRAIHTYLDQTVILQTFSEAIQQHSQFGSLQEQFLAKVRELVKQPSSSQVPVLDYFREGDLPFVVLKFRPDQSRQDSLPQLEDWFPISLDAPVETAQTSTDELKVKAAPTLSTADFATTETAQPRQQHPAPQSNRLRSPSHEPTRNVTVTVGGKQSSQVQAKAQTKDQTKSQAKAQTKAFTSGQVKSRIPIGLMVVALVGGATGAGMGLAFRLASTQPGESSNSPRISFFDREQSFSPEGDWPVQEDEIYSPEPAIEQPLYRTSPSIEYSPVPQPLPPETTGLSDPYSTYEVPPSPEAVAPVEPIDVPEVKTNPKLPEEVLPSLDAPGITESEPAVDPLPLDEPIAPPVTPQPVLPPIDMAPPQSNQKPLPNNSLNIVSQ